MSDIVILHAPADAARAAQMIGWLKPSWVMPVAIGGAETPFKLGRRMVRLAIWSSDAASGPDAGIAHLLSENPEMSGVVLFPNATPPAQLLCMGAPVIALRGEPESDAIAVRKFADRISASAERAQEAGNAVDAGRVRQAYARGLRTGGAIGVMALGAAGAVVYFGAPHAAEAAVSLLDGMGSKPVAEAARTKAAVQIASAQPARAAAVSAVTETVQTIAPAEMEVAALEPPQTVEEVMTRVAREPVISFSTFRADLLEPVAVELPALQTTAAAQPQAYAMFAREPGRFWR